MREKIFLYGILCVGCCAGLGGWYRYEHRYADYLHVAVIDVGQGSGVLVTTPEGGQLLLDVGFGRQVLRELSKLMSLWDRYIDFLLLSHPDQDHIGAVPDVFKRFGIGQTLMTRKSADTDLFRQVVFDLAHSDTQVTFIDNTNSIVLGDGYTLDILWPEPALILSETERNETSVVVRLYYGNVSFLIMGDAGVDTEKRLLALYGSSLQSDVLVVGHHGSKTSTSEAFIQAVRPTYAVISVGERNRYGHPHQEVLDTLTHYGVHVLRTDEKGTVQFISDGDNILVE